MLIGAGVILRNTLQQILLVCDARSGRWGFPKGHPEICDHNQPLNTAIREVWEETGLKAFEDYTIEAERPRRIGKRLYYRGFSNANSFHNAVAPVSEISDVKWWNVADLVGKDEVLNSDLRSWLKKMQYRSPTLGPSRSPNIHAATSL